MALGYLSGRAGQAVAAMADPIRPSHWPRVTGTTRFEIEPCRTAKKRARWAFGVNHRILSGPHFLFLMLPSSLRMWRQQLGQH